MNARSRILGGLYGSLVGDALGVPVEFSSREALRSDPVRGMREGGTHGQPKGTWSDDGALLLCTVESLVEKGFDTQDMGERFVRWSERGHWSAHGVVFDIGRTTRAALERISLGVPAEEAGGRDEYDNGNGSLMRILPVGLACMDLEIFACAKRLRRASAVTHAHLRSQLACVYLGLLAQCLMKDAPREIAVQAGRAVFGMVTENSPEYFDYCVLLPFESGRMPESAIRSGGYVMETLQAAVWCLLTTRSFEECVLKAVNLGDDTDTTGCVAGGLAGVHYGLEAIPDEWCAVLPRQEELRGLFDRFVERAVKA
ncbi:MAG TPA: ADP-ribosylglycohydrolase family protein [Candidatus Saccharimonadia bacterium]|nr:ADP-ribosylglycohydrolase family protein [Candidatus Saccharimonadia bacterium]